MKRQLIKIFKPVVEKFPRLAMTYRFIRDSWQINDEPQMTSLGFKFLGNPIMQSGNFEPEETKIFSKILDHADTFINVGANIGYYCCIALKHNKRVIAIEPMSLNLYFLYQNIKANNWNEMIEIYPMALSNKKAGIVEIYGSGTTASLIKGWSGIIDKKVTYVPNTTIDNILSHRLRNQKCFILVDIEGAEYAMLKGAESILSNTPKPIWMIEILFREHQPESFTINPNFFETFQIFWQNGYEARTADHRFKLINPDEIIKIESSGIDSLNTHNFLFIDKEMKFQFNSND